MNEPLFNIVYCSRNRLSGEEEEVARELENILATARKNNAKIGITGALLYNAGSFAQVLEGPAKAIERVFEYIQRDLRHSEVTIIHSGPIEARQFPEWSMAYSGNSSIQGTAQATAAFDAVFAQRAGASDQMLTLLQDLIVDGSDWVVLDVA